MKINCDQMLRENRCLQCLEGAEIPCWVHKLNLIMMLASKLSYVFKMEFQILNALKMNYTFREYHRVQCGQFNLQPNSVFEMKEMKVIINNSVI